MPRRLKDTSSCTSNFVQNIILISHLYLEHYDFLYQELENCKDLKGRILFVKTFKIDILDVP